MATEEQIELLMERLKKAPPSQCFQNVDMNTMGIRAILKILNETEETVTAGMISDYMHVSTARVAVLLKKMVAKGLIEKKQDSRDGRVVIVTLSSEGKRIADQLRQNLYSHMGALIDQIGMARMLEFSEISDEIQKVMQSQKNNIEDGR